MVRLANKVHWEGPKSVGDVSRSSLAEVIETKSQSTSVKAPINKNKRKYKLKKLKKEKKWEEGIQ